MTSRTICHRRARARAQRIAAASLGRCPGFGPPAGIRRGLVEAFREGPRMPLLTYFAIGREASALASVAPRPVAPGPGTAAPVASESVASEPMARGPVAPASAARDAAAPSSASRGAKARRAVEPRPAPLGSAWLLALLLLLGPATVAPLAPLGAGPACAQVEWLSFEDGEILNVASADGPPAGAPFLQFRRSTEKSDARGRMTISRARFLYGVTPHVTAGVSGTHLEQELEERFKRGLGDTNLQLKLHFQPWREHPIRVGLRQTLSLPTGYERESDGLAPFTSRHNDYAAQLLFQYVTPGFAGYLNPGVLLPGGDADSRWTGGVGLAFALPFGLDARGEYFTRYNMVTRDFESETYIGARKNLWWGLALQGGMKRRLLQDGKIDPEIQLGLCLGRDRGGIAKQYAFRQRTDTGLIVHPVEMRIPDPHGLGHEFTRTFQAEPTTAKNQPLVFVRPVPAAGAYGSATPNASNPGFGSPGAGRMGAAGGALWPDPAASARRYEIPVTPRNYELNVKILQVYDAEVSGVDLSPVARVARAVTTVVGESELIAPDGYSVLGRKLFHGRASKLIELSLVPEPGSLESIVPPDEVKASLRTRAVRDLTRQIRGDAVATIQLRDFQ